jgi:hypothetical protein
MLALNSFVEVIFSKPVRLAIAETSLEAEREKNAMLQRHLDDVRRMLPPPDAKPRRRWWPF